MILELFFVHSRSNVAIACGVPDARILATIGGNIQTPEQILLLISPPWFAAPRQDVRREKGEKSSRTIRTSFQLQLLRQQPRRRLWNVAGDGLAEKLFTCVSWHFALFGASHLVAPNVTEEKLRRNQAV